MSAESGDDHVTGIVKYFVYGIFILIALLLFASGFPWLVEMPFHLICGWALHGWKALPFLIGKWEAAVLPVGCLILAGILIHRFIQRWASAKRPSLEWRISHTVAALSLVLLCSGAAIATSGVVHQFFWLARGKVIVNRGKNVEVIMTVMDGRQLTLYMVEFFAKKDRYPLSLEELKAEFEDDSGFSDKLCWVRTGDKRVPEPWVFLRPGSTIIAFDEDPLIVSPLLRDGTRRVVGFGDTSVRTLTATGFAEMMEARGKEAASDE